MELAQFVLNEILVERRSVREVATEHGVSKTWLYELLARYRRDRIDRTGKVTLRYRSALRHLGIGRRYAGTRVLILVADREVKVITEDGELLAEFTIDPTKQYQAQKRPGQGA
jgi:transposase-like protein